MAELIVPAHLRKRHDDGMQRYLSSGAPVILGRPVEMEALRADGTVFPIELAITEMRQAGGGCSPPFCATSPTDARSSGRCAIASTSPATTSRASTPISGSAPGCATSCAATARCAA